MHTNTLGSGNAPWDYVFVLNSDAWAALQMSEQGKWFESMYQGIDNWAFAHLDFLRKIDHCPCKKFRRSNSERARDRTRSSVAVRWKFPEYPEQEARGIRGFTAVDHVRRVAGLNAQTC